MPMPDTGDGFQKPDRLSSVLLQAAFPEAFCPSHLWRSSPPPSCGACPAHTPPHSAWPGQSREHSVAVGGGGDGAEGGAPAAPAHCGEYQ